MTKAWDISIDIEESSKIPLFQKLANAVIREIVRGRFIPGSSLPGTRVLAAQLGLNRNTVVDAYHELLCQGWVRTIKGKGTIVSPTLEIEEQNIVSASADPSASVDPSPLLNPRRLELNDGHPDARLFPMDVFARTFGRIARSRGIRLYSRLAEPKGSLRLRLAIAKMLHARRGMNCSGHEVLITRGSQQAVFLIAQALKQPTSKVLVESPGCVLAADAFRLAGFEIIQVPVDAGGICVDKIDALIKRVGPVSALCVTPHYQYPTTVTLKADRRLKLLDLASQHQFWVIEDDYHHDFHYGTTTIFPLASMQSSNQVVYVSSLSKILAVGLRVGYVVVPAPLLPKMVQVRSVVDRVGDPLLEETIAEMMEEGDLQRHANKMRHIYDQRLTRLCEGLLRRIPSLKFQVPQGGMAVWIPFPSGLGYAEFVKRLATVDVVPLVAAKYWYDKEKEVSGTRIGFASLNDAEIDRVVDALAIAFRD